MKLRMMSSNTVTPSTTAASTPTRLFDRYKKPMLDTTNTSISASPLVTTMNVPRLNLDTMKRSPIASRLQAMANSNASITNQVQPQQAIISKIDRVSRSPLLQPPNVEQQQNSFNSIQFNAFIPVNSKSNQSTPNNVSPMQFSNSNDSEKKTPVDSGHQLSLSSTANNSNGNSSSFSKKEDEDSRQSFSSPGSAGMPSPIHNGKLSVYQFI